MGFLDSVFGGSDKRRDKTIDRAAKKLKNPHHQSDERKRQIEILTDIGTADAVFAMLGRFSMRTPGSIVDEDEKQLVFRSLIHLGDVAVEPIQRFIATQDAVYWPLRALTEIAGETIAVDTLLAALTQVEHGYNADMDRKEQLVANLREYLGDSRAVDKLTELADDPHEEVRVQALDALCETSDERVAALVARKILDPEETGRVRTTLWTILVDRGIDMSHHREELAEHIPDSMFMDGNGVIQRR